MLSTIKGYLIAGAGVVVAVFLAIFQYRGAKIDALKDDNEALKDNSDKLDDVIAKKEKELKLNETVNKIHSQPDNVDLSRERLRQRRKDREGRSK
jgi:hypothetical protein